MENQASYQHIEKIGVEDPRFGRREMEQDQQTDAPADPDEAIPKRRSLHAPKGNGAADGKHRPNRPTAGTQMVFEKRHSPEFGMVIHTGAEIGETIQHSKRRGQKEFNGGRHPSQSAGDWHGLFCGGATRVAPADPTVAVERYVVVPHDAQIP